MLCWFRSPVLVRELPLVVTPSANGRRGGALGLGRPLRRAYLGHGRASLLSTEDGKLLGGLLVEQGLSRSSVQDCAHLIRLVVCELTRRLQDGLLLHVLRQVGARAHGCHRASMLVILGLLEVLVHLGLVDGRGYLVLPGPHRSRLSRLDEL